MFWIIIIALCISFFLVFIDYKSSKKQEEYIKACEYYRYVIYNRQPLNIHGWCGFTGSKGDLCNNCPLRDIQILIDLEKIEALKNRKQ